MSLKSKNTITGLAAGVLSLIGYVVYALSGAAPAGDNIKDWAIVILIAIGIAIGLQIIVYIIFYIAAAIGITAKTGNAETAERTLKAEMKDDERGKQINR